MLIYGSRATQADSFRLKDIPCVNCGHQATYTMTFFAKYAHLYWIPTFPIGKTSVAECDLCKRTFAEEEYTEVLHNCKNELRGRVKAPVWNWIGLGIIGLIIVVFSIFG